MGQNLILDLTLPFCITVDMFECLFFTKNNKEKTVNQINQNQNMTLHFYITFKNSSKHITFTITEITITRGLSLKTQLFLMQMYFYNYMELKSSSNYKSYIVFTLTFHIYSIKRIAISPQKLTVTFKTVLSIFSIYKFRTNHILINSNYKLKTI